LDIKQGGKKKMEKSPFEAEIEKNLWRLSENVYQIIMDFKRLQKEIEDLKEKVGKIKVKR
jgi:hypothetical protein